MCESNAYLIEKGQEHLVMKSVDIAEPEGDDAWRLVGIFGDQKTVKGRIKGMNLLNHKILFEAQAERDGRETDRPFDLTGQEGRRTAEEGS